MEEPDQTEASVDDAGAAERKVSSSEMFAAKYHRKSSNPAQSLKKIFKAKSR